jgi:uncharacterized membrane protein
MPVTEESIVIPAPPEEVFDYIDDPRNLPTYDSTILHAEIEGDGPVQVGSRFKGTSKILGRTFDWVVEVTENERPKKQAIRSVEGKIEFCGTYTLTPEGEGTRLDYRLESAAGLGGVFGRIGDALVNKAYSRQTRANLATLSEILTEHKES